ncbi:hypothetical protein [Haloarcula sp. JP-L23]|uniref:hypothetical protein n=1 Tax=Haloarcula sp. JP-L23 TaxID=2716717 RepID=UPI001D04A25E
MPALLSVCHSTYPSRSHPISRTGGDRAVSTGKNRKTLGSEDFYREDLENLLQEGAWREGFEEWAEYTDLDEEEVRVVDDLDLFQAFDFYRDPTDDHLRFDAPTVPEDWRERDVTESLDSSSVSAINGELHDLGRAVHETLQNYLQRTRDASDRNEEPFGEREE